MTVITMVRLMATRKCRWNLRRAESKLRQQAAIHSIHCATKLVFRFKGNGFVPSPFSVEQYRGFRSWEYGLIWDARRRCERKTGIIALPVQLPEDQRPLFLVVSRPGYGRKPWYLITTEPVFTAEQAWQIVFAYARRWQIEMSLRFTKSEMAFESPRLRNWESRLKFLLIASLAYAFLLTLLPNTDFLFHLFSRYCHRTGKWSRDLSTPLYRLRLAISRLFLAVRPHSLPSLISG
jgi:Transposase DDE domain